MKQNLGLVQKMRVTGMAGLLMFGMTFAGAHAQANPQPFSHLFVFGDSLCDNGNYYRLSGGYPPAPYAGGRYCNGPVWVEYLATSLGMDYRPGENFAVAGATTGTLNYNNGYGGKQYPGLQDEVASFRSQQVTEPERALYVVEAGPNDFFIGQALGTSPGTIIANGVNNTLKAIQELRTAGARFILVMKVPDLGVTPLALSQGLGTQLSQLTAAYNQILDSALDQLALAGIPTIRLDAFSVLDDMANSPANYDFSNVTFPLLFAPAGANADDFLFWDPVHPTTNAHKVLAEEALDQVISAFSPGQMKGRDLDNVQGLNGWVNASMHKN
jgi:outer membrane lipase/esterase